MSALLAGNQYCSILSAEAGEVLVGSAPPAEIFLMLEYLDPWDRDALESQLPATLKDHLVRQLKQIPASKFLLVRGSHQPYGTGPRFFIACTKDKHPVLYRFQLDHALDLLQMDLQAIVSIDPRYDTHRMDEPLFLVCTHGKRDVCCAKFGLPVYRELQNIAGSSLWQSSHLGGHRFAPNLLVLPHGLLYARLGSQTAREAVEAYQRREILPDYLRGRTCYPPPAQAAEYHLRKYTKQVGLDDFTMISLDKNLPGRRQVVFQERSTGVIFKVEIEIDAAGFNVYESCLADHRTENPRYSLVGIETFS
jgi:hypothetical protein